MKMRVAFALTESGRFLGHLDLNRNWNRLLRRARLPLAYSQGFSPKPRIAFGSALAVGTTSAAEYLDIGLTEEPSLTVVQDMQAVAPPAFHVLEVGLLDPGCPSLMAVINRARYRVALLLGESLGTEDAERALEALLLHETLPMTRFRRDSRKNREIDIRPGIVELSLAAHHSDKMILDMLLHTGPDGNIKPTEVVYSLLNRNLLPVREVHKIHRTGLYITEEGALVSPMQVACCHPWPVQ